LHPALFYQRSLNSLSLSLCLSVSLSLSLSLSLSHSVCLSFFHLLYHSLSLTYSLPNCLFVFLYLFHSFPLSPSYTHPLHLFFFFAIFSPPQTGFKPRPFSFENVCFSDYAITASLRIVLFQAYILTNEQKQFKGPKISWTSPIKLFTRLILCSKLSSSLIFSCKEGSLTSSARIGPRLAHKY
jgi:hypothetical protein